MSIPIDTGLKLVIERKDLFWAVFLRGREPGDELCIGTILEQADKLDGVMERFQEAREQLSKELIKLAAPEGAKVIITTERRYKDAGA